MLTLSAHPVMSVAALLDSSKKKNEKKDQNINGPISVWHP